MASVVLANRNDTSSNWTGPPQPRGGGGGGGGGGGPKFMGKVPFSSNPNPKFSKKRQFQSIPAAIDVDESPAFTQSAASDDASSINRRPLPPPSLGNFNSGEYVTFNIASYSKKQLAELKHRLISELEQIRQLKNRINSPDFQIRSHNKSKKISGNKRPFPPAPAPKRENSHHFQPPPPHPERAQLMKSCGQILSKLMKQKHAYIFNSPVDVVDLQLHDYYDIIKHPMDLGTVKSKLGKNLYDSPRDFAADVRLTFNNAMKYNPKGHEVYALAEVLLSKFEESYRPIREKVGEDEDEYEEAVQVQEVQASSWDHNRGVGEIDKGRKDHDSPMQVPPPSVANQNVQSAAAAQLPVRTPSPMRAPPVKPAKLPKPKAKDPNKREMTLEEKHKLGIGLQSLPQEKMDQVVAIIKRRNGNLRQDGDEIELDIEAVDTETLWELDRFVTNYKKMVSKIKRQALMGLNNANATTNAANDSNKDVPTSERVDVGTEAKKPKKGEVGDEDVDIGDEMPMSSFPPVEIEKDNGHASSSSSSSSSSSDDSSSSSDSDSGSSSGSDSEDAHS